MKNEEIADCELTKLRIEDLRLKKCGNVGMKKCGNEEMKNVEMKKCGNEEMWK